MAADSEELITESTNLYRRIHASQIVPDEKEACGFRVSSGAFDDPKMSADVELLFPAHEWSIEKSLEKFPDGWLTRLPSSVCAEANQEIWACDGDTPVHAEVRGKKTPAVKKLLRKEAMVVLKGPQSKGQ